jgi:hypothetical protein
MEGHETLPHYTKYLFIPIEKPIELASVNVLVNQLYEALASPVSTIDIVHAGFDRTLSIRVTYRADGYDPDDDDDDEN